MPPEWLRSSCAVWEFLYCGFRERTKVPKDQNCRHHDLKYKHQNCRPHDLKYQSTKKLQTEGPKLQTPHKLPKYQPKHQNCRRHDVKYHSTKVPRPHDLTKATLGACLCSFGSLELWSPSKKHQSTKVQKLQTP